MIRRDNKGRIIESRRAIDTRVSGELLIGDGWEAIAQTEIKKLALTVRIYQKQLVGGPGHLELSRAVEALDEACSAIEESADFARDE